jgi:hypothetical protein
MHCAYSPNAEQANLNVIVIVLYLQVVILDHHYHCNNTFHVEKTYMIQSQEINITIIQRPKPEPWISNIICHGLFCVQQVQLVREVMYINIDTI